MDISRYNKLIAVVVGNALGFLLVWLAAKTQMASCTIVDAKTVCTLLGMSQAELTGLVMALITSVAVYAGPKNSSTNAELVKEVTEATSADNKGTKLVRKLELENTPEARAINAVTSDTVTVTRAHPLPPSN